MVSRQKVDTKKKKWAVNSRRATPILSRPRPLMTQPPSNHYRPQHHWGPPNNHVNDGSGRRGFNRPSNNYHQHTDNQQQFNHNRPPRFRQAQHRNDPLVPSYVQTQIHNLVYQHADGLPLTHFTQIFRRHYGVSLDVRQLGFQTEYELLTSIPSVVSVKRFEQGELRVLPLRSSTDGGQTMEERSRPNVFSQKSPSSALTQTTIKDRSPSPKAQTEEADWDQLFDSTSCNIPDNVQRNIDKLMNEHPDGIKASDMLFEYKNLFKTELAMKTYGYNSVIEFVSDLSHIIRIERPNKFDWMLYPVKIGSKKSPGSLHKAPGYKKSNTDDASSSLTRQSPGLSPPSIRTACYKVEDELKEAISQVLSLNPKGIPVDRFLDTFKEMTGRDLDVKKYGTDSVKGFLHSLTDILYIMLDISDVAVVCSIYEGGPRRFDQLQDRYKPITPLSETQLSESTKRHNIPAQAVMPGCYYRPQPVSYIESDGNQKYIELYVSFTSNPGHFWIQLRGQKTTLALETLMDDLEAAYGDVTKPSSSNKDKEYRMTPELAQPGMVCAVVYHEDQYWHRGLITGVKDNLYEVFFVDYGNTCFVSLENMRFLKAKFLSLPTQAIRGRLSNIQPCRQTWAVRARQRFLDLTKERPLLGFVTAFKNRILSLCLTDTSGAEDIHINDLLTNEGYARFEPDTEESIATDDTFTCSQVLTTNFLYGDHTPKDQEDSNQNQAGGAEASPWRRYVRQAQMSENLVFNLIHLGTDDLYVMSSEISSLFFDEDIISAKLRKDKTEIPKVVVPKESYPELYEELLSYEVSAINKTTPLLSLFPMKALPLMMEMYGKDRDLEEVKNVVLEILEWFDPNDPYWKGEDDNSTESGETDGTGGDNQSVASDSKDSFKMEDLQMVLKMLQMKRNRSLKKLLEGGMGESKVDEVNSLNQVEVDIRRVEAFIESLEKKNGSEEAKPVQSRPTTNANVVKPTGSEMGRETRPQTSIPATTTSTLPQYKPLPHPTQTNYSPVTPVTATVAPTPHLTSAAALSTASLPCGGVVGGSVGSSGGVDMGDLMRQQMAINSWLMSQMGLTNPMASLTPQPFSVEQLQQQQTLLQQQLQQQQLLLRQQQQQQQQQQSLLPSFLPSPFPVTSSISSSLLLPPAAPGFSHADLMMRSQLNNLNPGSSATSGGMSNLATLNQNSFLSNSQLAKLNNPTRKS